MSDIAIQVEHLSKQYEIGEIVDRHRTLRDSLAGAVAAPFRRLGRIWSKGASGKSGQSQTLWALKDISFEINQGDVVGIIGRNGAGKSTLLKVLSRITEPTTGSAYTVGRVGSLLEVGTGFHPELTGRENIYLNGAILGMKKTETERKFDQIVSFAEIERFIDTPVKRYSTGMYLRLAFAVAAHLEPQILLVDEVLAVGDIAFQKKCLSKMGDVAKLGQTILMVSHNMAAILNLCQRAILIEGGRVIANGPCQEVVEQYIRTTKAVMGHNLAERKDRQGNQDLTFIDVEFRNSDGLAVPRVCSGQDITVALRYRSAGDRPLRDVHVAVGVQGRFEEKLFHLSTSINGFEFDSLPPCGTITCEIPQLPLQPGLYTLTLFSRVGRNVADALGNAAALEVEAGDFFGIGRLPPPGEGAFLVKHSWKAEAA
jgi:lipopolysaccharide transport system ATP-binding protein